MIKKQNLKLADKQIEIVSNQIKKLQDQLDDLIDQRSEIEAWPDDEPQKSSKDNAPAPKQQ